MSGYWRSSQTPWETSQSIIENLQDIKAKCLAELDYVNNAIAIAESADSYYRYANTSQLSSTDSGGTALMVQSALHHLVASANGRMLESQQISRAIFSAASAYGYATNSVHSSIHPVPTYSPNSTEAAIQSQAKSIVYIQKFTEFDLELGKLYKQIVEVMGRTTSYPEKSIQSDLRQAFDCLIYKLAPKSLDSIIKQMSWFPSYGTHGKNPNDVSTVQRIRYAAEKHISNPDLLSTVIENSEPMFRTYQRLSENFHQTGRIDVAEASRTGMMMLNFLNLWADALNL